jgi:hypothetical protein
MRSLEGSHNHIENERFLEQFDSTTIELVASLAIILGEGNFYITNGASLYFRLRTLGIARIPTDLDIVAPGYDLRDIQNSLDNVGIASTYDFLPVHKWDLEYNEPQLRGELHGIPFDLVSKSTIIKSSGSTLQQHHESSSPDWVVHNGVWIPLAKLATVKEAKEFQLRPHPKQDISDLKHIELLIKLE